MKVISNYLIDSYFSNFKALSKIFYQDEEKNIIFISKIIL